MKKIQPLHSSESYSLQDCLLIFKPRSYTISSQPSLSYPLLPDPKKKKWGAVRRGVRSHSGETAENGVEVLRHRTPSEEEADGASRSARSWGDLLRQGQGGCRGHGRPRYQDVSEGRVKYLLSSFCHNWCPLWAVCCICYSWASVCSSFSFDVGCWWWWSWWYKHAPLLYVLVVFCIYSVSIFFVSFLS